MKTIELLISWIFHTLIELKLTLELLLEKKIFSALSFCLGDPVSYKEPNK